MHQLAQYAPPAVSTPTTSHIGQLLQVSWKNELHVQVLHQSLHLSMARWPSASTIQNVQPLQGELPFHPTASHVHLLHHPSHMAAWLLTSQTPHPLRHGARFAFIELRGRIFSLRSYEEHRVTGTYDGNLGGTLFHQQLKEGPGSVGSSDCDRSTCGGAAPACRKVARPLVAPVRTGRRVRCSVDGKKRDDLDGRVHREWHHSSSRTSPTLPEPAH